MPTTPPTADAHPARPGPGHPASADLRNRLAEEVVVELTAEEDLRFLDFLSDSTHPDDPLARTLGRIANLFTVKGGLLVRRVGQSARRRPAGPDSGCLYA